jgi:UDP-3-O-[3-hydroxymyristoyl] glucosamine N-acyltransferase
VFAIDARVRPDAHLAAFWDAAHARQPLTFASNRGGPARMSIGDPRFFARSGPYPLATVAEVAGGTAPEIDLLLTGVAPLQTARQNEVSFLDNRRYAAALEATSAGAVILHPDMIARVPSGVVPIVTPNPYEGWARVASLFHPEAPRESGIHPTAFVDERARVDASAEVGPFALVAAGAEIGARCRIGPYAAIGQGVVIGPDCRIGAHTALSHAILGARVYVYPGARIGQEGFSFARTKDGFLSVRHLGHVVLGDDVEVGANTTIDRGSTGDTVIGAGSRLSSNSRFVTRMVPSALAVEALDCVVNGRVEQGVVAKGPMREMMPLQVPPAQLDVVEFWRVTRQPFDDDPAPCSERCHAGLRGMDWAVVQDQNHRFRRSSWPWSETGVEFLQQGDEVGTSFCG